MSREAVMTALFGRVTAAIAPNFTGNVAAGSANIVTGIASTAGLFPGVPVGNNGLGPTAVINSVDSASQVTLSDPATLGTGLYFVTGFRTVGRRLKWWSDVAAQPALFLRNAGEEVAEPRAVGLPGIDTLHCEIWLYNKATSPDDAPAIELNNLIDAVATALKPETPGYGLRFVSPANPNGLVIDCYIAGRIEMYPGDANGQAIAIVPVRVLGPTFV